MLFPIPVTLPIDKREDIREGVRLALRDLQNRVIAVMSVEDIFQPDYHSEALSLCGPVDGHPLAAEMRSWGKYYVSGPMDIIHLPAHLNFPELR